MRDRRDRDRGDGHDVGRSSGREQVARPSAREPSQLIALTPEPRAEATLEGAGRDVDAVEKARAAVETAQQMNKLDAWREAHGRLTTAIDEATKALEGARTESAEARLVALAQLEKRLEDVTQVKAKLDIAPKGYVEIALEAELLAAIKRRPAGNARDGFAQKEAEVGTLMAELNVADSRNLLARIQRQLRDDELAKAFLDPSNLLEERQKRLREFLQGARRREAIRVARTPRAPAARPQRPKAVAGTAVVEDPGRDGASDAPSKHEQAAEGMPGPVAGRSLDLPAASVGPLPYRAEMERSFDRPLGHVKAYTGMDAELAPYGAQALTAGPVVMFADARPSPAIVAHEVTHTTQNEKAGAAAPMAAGTVGPRHSPAEAEAEAMAARVAVAGPGVNLPPVVAAPAASVQLAPQGETQHEATVAPAAHDLGATSSRATSDDRSAEPLSAERYWVKYGARTMQSALHRAMAEVVFEIAAPGLSFPTSECGPFILSSFGWRMQDTAPPHVSQLLDAPLYELIDGVRVLDDHDRGPDACEPAIVSRIVERLGLGIHRALARLALPYAKARSRLASAAKAAGPGPIGQGLGPGPIQVPERDAAQQQPDPNALGARSAIERAVAESLCAGFVEFHPARFPVVYDTAIPGEPRPVKLALERGRGDWLTVRVVEPASASAADVANALYGTPELAHLIVGSGTRYAYVFPPGKQLAEPYETEFRSHMIDDGASPLDELGARNTQDPVLGLDEGLADQRALTSAKASGAVATGAGVAPALQRLEILQSVIDSIASAAAPLGVAPIIAPLQARVRQRRTACAADPAEATKWAAHASEQLALVSDAKAGFDAITEQMFATGLPAASTAGGPELVGDVTASMQGPTRELAAAFAAAVAASEQLDIGHERLATAKERLAAYPFDMADRMLAVIRKRIASTGHHATLPMNSYETVRMAALEAELGRTIGELRIAVVNGDGTAALKLTALRSQLSMLDLQSTIGSTLTAINELSGELPRVESMDPDKAREAWIHEQLHAAMGEWMQFAANYDAFYQAGHARDPATLEMIRARLQALRSKTDLPALVHELAMYAEDEGKRQRWINIGIMIGAALLAAASGGVASGAIGGVAGSIVGAGIESLTFTAITSTLNQDPSFGGFMAELALNFATFGGLRAISGGAKFLAGGKLTLAQKLVEMSIESLWMVASAKAQEKIAEAFAHGAKVTPQSAANIFGQQMAISFASRVLVRVGGVFVQGVAGVEKLHEVQLALAKRAEEEQLARQVLASGDGKLGEQLVKVDTAVLETEQHALERVHEVASNPAEAATHGIAAEPGALERVAADAKGAAREVREREIAALMAHAEVKADHAIVEPPVYAELLAKHRAQGSAIVEGFDSAGQPHAKITPSVADGSFGAPFTLHVRLGDEVEKILAAKKLPNTAVIGDYLTKRTNDRPGALADLRKVNTPAELEQLMKRILGEKAVAPCARAAKPEQPSASPVPDEGNHADSVSQIEAALGKKLKPEEVKALKAALGDDGMAALVGGPGERLPEFVAEAGNAAIIASVKKFGAPATARLLECLGGNGLGRLLNDAEKIALQLDAEGNRGSYRWGGTSKTTGALEGGTTRVHKSADPASGARTLDVETPSGSIKLEERGRYADARIEPSKLSPEDTERLDKLFADYGITDQKAKQSVLEALENARLGNNVPDLAPAIKKVRSVLDEAKASAKKATDSGNPTTVQDVIMANGKDPLARETEGPAIIEAKALIAGGILENREFLSARTIDEGRDIVSQRLQASVGKGRAENVFGKKGGKVFTKVEFKGDLFVDETSANRFVGSDGKPVKGTDVAPDLDVAYAVENNNGKLSVEYVAGVKIVKSGSAATASGDAASQNLLGKAAVEAGSKRYPTTTRRGDHVWAEVRSVTGHDETGTKLDLTGKLVWDPAAKTETIGSRGTRGFDASLPISKIELDDIVVAIWRLAELRKR